LYLAYTAPHWPLQAYPEDIAKYKGKYDKGWDVMRKERYNRMVKMGIVKSEWKLSSRDGAVPEWESLNDSTKNYWSKMMEIYAAMIDRMDQGIGKVISELERTKQLDNTLIMFVADNGGCAESLNKKYEEFTGEMGSGNSFLAYETNWANVSNVPFRFFKHWMHEGGISTPFVARYPKAIKAETTSSVPAHLVDIMATCLDVSNTKYLSAKNPKLKPLDGKSLLPVFRGRKEALHEVLFFEHLGYRALRKGDYKIVSTFPKNTWELYNLSTDRTELNDLSKTMPEKVEELDALYTKMAKENNVMEWSKVPKVRKGKK
jgi:arylsulfatase